MIPWIYEHLLIVLVASPLLGVLILLVTPRRYQDASSEIALVSTGTTLFISLLIFGLFNIGGRFAFDDGVAWLASFGASLHLAVDGLSVMLILATAFVLFATVLIYWKKGAPFQKEIYAAYLVFQLGLLGLLASVDILAMYIFMESSVIFFAVTVLLLKRPSHAGLPRFTSFMAVSSIIFLVIIVFLSVSAGSSDLLKVEQITIDSRIQIWLFALLFFGVCCRMGVFPCHSWVKEINGKYGSSEVLLLVFISGAYFMYRLLPSFAVAATLMRPTLTWIVATSIIISALIASAQKNFGSLITYVVMVYLGFILLGLVSVTPQGLAGSGVQMISLIVAVSAISVIAVLLKRKKIELYSDEIVPIFGSTPIFGLCFFVVILALAGTPWLSSFPGLFMAWMGLFKGSWVLALVTLLAIVFVALSLIGMLSKILLRDSAREIRKKNLNLSEMIFIAPFIILILAIGIFPDIILKYIKDSTEALWVIFSRQI